MGAASGKFYLHHIDPDRIEFGDNPDGNWAIDSVPPRTCKSCHNNDGYSAYTTCSDGSLPDRTDFPPTCTTGDVILVPDPLVRRVHGVHNGSNLSSALNTDPDLGDFRYYTGVVFPADIENCTKCHLDDSWQERPSTLACQACHDDVDVIAGTNHGGGAQPEGSCLGCHNDSIAPSIATAHVPATPAFANVVDVAISAPTSGTYYTTEQPTLTITVRNAAGTAIIDPATMTDTSFRRFNLFVSGPRARRMPVLTAAGGGIDWARAYLRSAAQAAAGWNLTTAVDFTVTLNGGAPLTLAVPGSLQTTGVTVDAVTAWLNGDATFAAAATAFRYTSGANNYVQITSDVRGTSSSVAVAADAGDAQSIMGWSTTAAAPIPSSYASNDLRLHPTDPVADDDPRVTRTATTIEYELDSVASLVPGTYVAWVEAGSAYPVGWDLLTFQVGTATVEDKIATNCTDCHEDTRMHASYFGVSFDTDICGSCHDYERQFRDRTATDTWVDGWGAAAASGRSNMGFGATPIARRVHGVHRLRYLDKPEQVHSMYAAPNNHFIFPQDVRNCVKCHSETDDWIENPGRVACLACHDSDAAQAHGSLMTFDPTPVDPWNGDEEESCAVCHGEDSEFAPDVVHNVWDPYAPPYPREPEE